MIPPLGRPPRAVASVAVVVALFLAGCLGSGTSNQTGSSDSPAEPVADGALLGTIAILVVTSELQPVVGAQVVLAQSERVGTSNQEGSVLFDGLEAGRYTVVAGKAGYRAAEERGRVVDLPEGETVDIRLVLDPIAALSEKELYHRTHIFRGFISCSLEWIRVSVLVNRSQCGKGVSVGGTNVGADPNENASHRWSVETIHIESIIMEADWQPSLPSAGTQLYFATHSHYTCQATSCQYNNEIGGKGGPSPVYHAIQEGPDKWISRTMSAEDVSKYPWNVHSIGRTYCPPGCALAVSFQQGYNLVVTAFYGEAAPDGWRAKS